jgi:hypothetical protein
MRKRTLYVWSGTLRGVRVQAGSAAQAVELAVQQNLPCTLRSVIRVSTLPRGTHPDDTYFEAPFEEVFPDLFDGDLEVRVVSVEEAL